MRFWLLPAKRGRKPGGKNSQTDSRVVSNRAQRAAKNACRDMEFMELYKFGSTLQEIGDLFGISRERVRQRLELNGVTWKDGGASARRLISAVSQIGKNNVKKARREERTYNYYGCSVEFYLSLGGGDKGTPSDKYRRQKNSAQHRGIEWRMTLKEWWVAWKSSGKWDQRGLGVGKYVMARLCDLGPYSIDNVDIITHQENSSEARRMDRVRKNLPGDCISHQARSAGLKVSTVHARLAKGWTLEDALSIAVGNGRKHRVDKSSEVK